MWNCQQDFQVIWQKGYRCSSLQWRWLLVSSITLPFFKLIHNGPLQSASLFFVTCLGKRKKRVEMLGFKVKVTKWIVSYLHKVGRHQCKQGLFIKCWICQWVIICSLKLPSYRPWTVTVLVKAVRFNQEFGIKMFFSGIDMACSRKCAAKCTLCLQRPRFVIFWW